MSVSGWRGSLHGAARLLRPARATYARIRGVAAQAKVRREFERFRELSAERRDQLPVRWEDRLLCLEDRTSDHGFDRHYVYHPAWAVRILAETRPEVHHDISSTLHFSTMLSAFMPVRYYEFRSIELGLSGLECASADLSALPFPDSSLCSLSCMHVVEHIGLGRYGDPLDPNGDLKAFQELQRVVAPGGSLLFVTPTGRPRVQFNAHRVYSYSQVVSYFDALQLREFSLVPDDPADGGLVANASQDLADRQSYGCGCYWFVKPAT